MEIQELKESSERIGQLYPILVDYYGNTIDGEHRQKANSEWKTVTLEHIKSKKDLLIARLVCNTIRRTVSYKEKAHLLGELAEIYLSEGKAIGKITYELAQQTGMSYSWVAKYLPDRFKDEKQSQRRQNSVTHRATNSPIIKDPPKDTLRMICYKNTDFVNLLLKKMLFTKLKDKAQELETTPTKLLYTAIMLILTDF